MKYKHAVGASSADRPSRQCAGSLSVPLLPPPAAHSGFHPRACVLRTCQSLTLLEPHIWARTEAPCFLAKFIPFRLFFPGKKFRTPFPLPHETWTASVTWRPDFFYNFSHLSVLRL